MIPQRVIFLSDAEAAPEIDRELLAQFRNEVDRRIRTLGTLDAETIPLDGRMAYMTTIPHIFYKRVMARWFMPNDEEAIVTGLRAGMFDIPPED